MSTVALHLVDIAAIGERDGEFARWLSERERARSRRFARPDLAARYIRAHGALRERLACHLSATPESLRFRRAPGGRPELVGERCRFSLSHCVDLALIAISDDAPVGVDVERRRHMSERLIARVLPRWYAVPAEAERRRHLALELWTCTEAALKSCGLGIAGLGALTLLPHPAEGVYRFELSRPFHGSGMAIALGLDEVHCGALAVPGDEVPRYRLVR